MTALTLALLGAALGMGLLLVGSAWTEPRQRRRVRRSQVNRDALAVQSTAAIAVAVLTLAATGWIVGALAGAAAGWWLSAAVPGRRRGVKYEQARIDALAAWCEQLRDLISAEHGVLGTVKATVATCPAVLRPEVARLATRLERQDPTRAVRQFAAEVDDPSADLVASVLLLALSRSGRTSELLTELAATTRERAAMRLRVEADRAGQHSEARFVIGFAVVVLAGIVTFARGSSFLDAYDTAGGQLVLAIVAVLFAGGAIWLNRLTRFARPARFLAVGDSEQ